VTCRLRNDTDHVLISFSGAKLLPVLTQGHGMFLLSFFYRSNITSSCHARLRNTCSLLLDVHHYFPILPKVTDHFFYFFFLQEQHYFPLLREITEHVFTFLRGAALLSILTQGYRYCFYLPYRSNVIFRC
jgi:hypothetical protein